MGKLRSLAFVFVVISTILVVSVPSLKATSPPRILAADAGDSWTTPVNISQTSWEASASSFGGGLAVDPQGNIHIIYTVYDGVDDDTREVFYVNNVAGSWSTPYNLTQNNIYDGTATITVDRQGNLHVLYVSYDSQDNEVFYVNKTSSGWSTPLNISQNTDNDAIGMIAVDNNGNLHAAWAGYDGSSAHDLEIFYANNTGGSWSAPLNVTQNDHVDNWVKLAIDAQNKAHIVWYGTGPVFFDIFYANNVEGSWSITNVTGNVINDVFPSMALDSAGNVHVAYISITGMDYGVFYMNKTGDTWGATVNISATNLVASSPSLVCDGSDKIHVAFYQNDSADYEIFYANNTAGVWGTPVNTTQSGLTERYPNMIIGRWGYAHIIYRHLDVDYDVFYIRSTEAVGPRTFGEFPILVVGIAAGVGGAVVIAAVAVWLLRKRG